VASRGRTQDDDLIEFLRRNIQKNIALDAMVLELRTLAQASRA
jgi:hypothetical protein